jgi:LysR family transcriptional regulator, transcriptional activator of the cysJI operon
MMLENFRLRVFREVAAQRSFRRAAEVLYISQPAVTQQIKALEDELGTRVFDRAGGKVRLTAAGEVLLRRAGEAEASLQSALEEIAALEGRVGGRLRIAASTTIAQYILPGLLADFATKHTGVRVGLVSANTEQVVRAIETGDVPLGLIEGPAHRHDLLVEHWLHDELVLVVAAGHKWAGRKIAPAMLRDATLLLREQGSGTRAVLEAALERAGVPMRSLNVGMELSSTEALLACVEAGLGAGFVSRFALRRQRALHTLESVRVTGLQVGRDLSLVRARGPKPAGVAGAFAEHLAEFAREVERQRATRKR